MKRFISLALMVAVGLRVASAAVVEESARNIPVAYEADVLVVGGGFAAVEAAVEAAQNGAKVFLAAPRPYLGEDLAGTLRLWREPGAGLELRL